MTKIICFANNKGGSGKSTTCANVGYAMSLEGKRVLLVDGDGQMNLTLSFFDEERTASLGTEGPNLHRFLFHNEENETQIVKTPYENLDILAGSPLLSRASDKLAKAEDGALLLRKKLEGIKESRAYDAICIDAPPTLGLWTTALLCASDALIIPVEASPWGLYGLANMFEFYAKARELNADLSFLGVVVTKADERKNYCKQTLASLREMDFIHFFETFIHSDTSIEWAQDSSMPVIAYKKSSRGAKEYINLTKEILHDVCRNKQSKARR